MTFTRCKTCVMPNTRPDVPFIDGECQACINYRNRPQIDWAARKQDLEQLLDRHRGRCLVASSGGKDSHYQVLTLKDMGADVTAITATTCHLTPIGRQNIDNLARYARTIEVTPNKTVRAKLNRLGLGLVGDISWPEHVGIFTIPFRMAQALDIPLIFYGENPQDAYGGPPGTEQARTMTRRWVSEFGGFLGLRPVDMIGQMGITEQDMEPYMPPDPAMMGDIEAHFLGQYLPWDSGHNAHIARKAGMRQMLPCQANLWPAENLDNAQTGLHDYFGWLKYGYGRGCAQVSIDIRSGKTPRAAGVQFIKANDGQFPFVYAGVRNLDVLDQIGMNTLQLLELVSEFTNRDLFNPRQPHSDPARSNQPQLKDWAC